MFYIGNHHLFNLSVFICVHIKRLKASNLNNIFLTNNKKKKNMFYTEIKSLKAEKVPLK